uniref:Sucrose phosphatase-like domain-containing protein n=1 Tax=Haptolina brevifila TaxID=156173 RepID=A0A7S2CXT3_9EUKA
MATADIVSSERPRRLKAIFSDLDGTLVHFPAWFEEHGSRVVSSDETKKRAVVESPNGERRDCRMLPSSTMGPGLVSERTAELVDSLRAEGVLFVVVTAARKSTLLERWPLLPACDARVCETGSRVYLGDALDGTFSARFEHITGPLDRELDVEARPEPLWKFFRSLQVVPNLKCDSRSYYGCFRADTKGDAATEEALRAHIAAHLPEDVDWAMNLGKFDFFPAASGKGNVVKYLQEHFSVSPDECACLFDDDNDLPMARQCITRMLPGLTSDSVRRAALENPDWFVASKAGQGVFAIEECLEELLRRVRGETSAVAADEPLPSQVG